MDLVTRIPAAVTSRLDGWFGVIRESFAGAWQRNVELNVETSLSHCTAWTCVTLIVSDIAKLRPMLMQETEGISTEVDNPSYSPILRKPNHFQNRIQFITCWMISKLTRGNTYALKRRNGSGKVTALYVLDPTRVRVLVASNGEVYYELTLDPLSTLSTESTVTVPASEIIHDILIPLYHPLVGVSAFYALGAVVSQGLKIIANSSKVFANGSHPGGVLTAPGTISNENAERVQKHWDANFSGEENVGKVAVLGDGLKFEKMSMTAVDLQLIDQLKWGDEKICGALHVPAYMAGVGASPTYQNGETMNQQYYSQCLQSLIEAFELCLSEGLSLANDLYVELDVENGLLRMDSATRMKVAGESISSGMAMNETRRKYHGLGPVAGGEVPFLQQQMWPVSVLANRTLDELTPQRPAPAPTPAATADPAPDAETKSIKAELSRRMTKAALSARVVERMQRAG